MILSHQGPIHLSVSLSGGAQEIESNCDRNHTEILKHFCPLGSQTCMIYHEITLLAYNNINN